MTKHWYIYISDPFWGYRCYGYYSTLKDAADRKAEELRRFYPLVEVISKYK